MIKQLSVYKLYKQVPLDPLFVGAKHNDFEG